MKKNLLFALGSLLLFANSFAASKYWVGGQNGNWNNSANWSLSPNGPGSAGVPGVTDSVIILTSSSINLDLSPTIAALTIGDMAVAATAKLYTGQNVVLTILGNLTIPMSCSLTDSTTSAVSFNVVFNGATAAKASILGAWIFSGATALADPETQGAFFTAQPDSYVTVGNNLSINARIVSRANAGVIRSTLNSFGFARYGACIFEDNRHVQVPNAYFTPQTYSTGVGGDITAPPAILQISGNVATIKHLSSPVRYGSVVFDLPTITQEVYADFPNGSFVSGDLTVLNTNNQTLVLLANTAPTVMMRISYVSNQRSPGCNLRINGATTKVALSKPALSDPPIDFNLAINDTYVQTGGSFSLQDNDIPAGSATIVLNGSLIQTGGVFFTNNATAATTDRFNVQMTGPLYVLRPGGTQHNPQQITLSSGEIESPQHAVTLYIGQMRRLNQTFTIGQETGVTLNTPVRVGKMRFQQGIVNSTPTNLLTITNPNPGSVSVLTDSSYVNGPVRITTNSTSSYTVPVGGTPLSTGSLFSLYNLIHYPGSHQLIPATSEASVFEGRYTNGGYTDVSSRNAPLLAVANDRYWDLTRVSGANAAVQLPVKRAVPNAAFDQALVVAHYENGAWAAVNGSVLRPGNTTTGTVTSRVLTTFSPFTLGIVSATEIPLAINFTRFTAQKVAEGASLDWSVESSPAKFDVLRSTNGINYASIGSVGAAVSKKIYKFTDHNPASGINYYRIKSIEADGSTSFSIINALSNGNNDLAITSLAPSLVRSSAKLFITSSKAGKLDLVVTDMSGKSRKRLGIEVSSGNGEKLLNLADLPAGTYQISGTMNQAKTKPLRFIKL